MAISISETNEHDNVPDTDTAEGAAATANADGENILNAGATEDNEASDNSVEEQIEAQSKLASYTRIIIGLLFVALVIFVIVDSTTEMRFFALQDFLQWVEDNPRDGVFAFVAGE